MKIKVKRSPVFEIYRASDGWRWRLRAKNSKIICDGSEAYKKIPDAEKTIAAIVSAMSTANWRVL